ncbi:hypothetical protein GC175_18220 [bacterium]|nr:hypothetical protein [bacterium]
MKRVLAFLAVSLVWIGLAWGFLFSWIPAHAQEEWTRLDGPIVPGGPVMAVAASSAQSNTLYTLVDHPYGVRLFRSAADTIAWTQVVTLSSEISPTLINALFVDPGDGAVLYTHNGSATLRSQDGGLSWTEIFTAAGPMAVPAPSTIFVLHPIAAESASSDDCFDPWTIARSDDAGDQWQTMDVPCLGAGSGLAVAQSDPQIIYLTPATGFNTLYRSIDGGKTWQGNRSLPPGARIAIDPTDDSHLLASGFGDVRQSYDAGESWASLFQRPFRAFFDAPEIHFAGDGRIYIGAQVAAATFDIENTVPVIYRSHDKGRTWWLATELMPEFGMRLLVSPVDPSTLFSWSRSRGVLRSPNQGNGWQEANEGILSPVLIQSIEPDDAGDLYVGASRFNQARNGLFHSADGGITWRTVLTDTQVQKVVSTPGTDQFVAIAQGRFYQNNIMPHGSSELHLVLVTDVDILASNPFRPLLAGYRRNTEYQYEGIVSIRNPDIGPIRSDWGVSTIDSGRPNWLVSVLSGAVSVTAAVIDPNQPTRMYVAAVMTDGLTTIFRSEDGGVQWQPIASPANEHGVPYRIDRLYVANSRIYAGGFGVIYSDDDGNTWHELSSRTALNDTIIGTHLSVSNDGQVFAFGETDAYRWNVILHDWERLNLPGGSAYALAIDNSGNEETLLVSNAQGIWKRNVPLAPVGSIWLPTIERQ